MKQFIICPECGMPILAKVVKEIVVGKLIIVKLGDGEMMYMIKQLKNNVIKGLWINKL